MKTPAEHANAQGESHEAWLARSLALLDASADALDAATLSRLNRARQAALAQRGVARRYWMLGGGLAGAAIAMLLVIGIGMQHRVDDTPVGTPAIDGTDVVAATDDLDLYENLDFYQWLDQQQPGDNG